MSSALIGLRCMVKDGNIRGRIRAVLDNETQNMLVVEFDEPRKRKIQTIEGDVVDTLDHMQVYFREDIVIL